MAFTVNLDELTEKLLKDIAKEAGLKSKSKAIYYLVHSYEANQKLANDYLKLQRENEVLCDINFANKIANRVVDLLSKKRQ